MENAIECRHITKVFGKIVANKDVSMDIRHGEILSLLGENGSGKTTLMNMISGIYFPDSGEILVNGKPVEIRDPGDAYKLGIAMVHQHFKLIDVFTALENIALGLNDGKKFDLKKIREGAQKICDRYDFDLDLNQKVYEMSVSQKQTLEIVKALYRGADVLILDEPTAVLTPQESDKLFDVIRNMREDGKSVVIITHKLSEVMEISDRVTILRQGEYVGTVVTKEASEAILTEMMFGQKIDLEIDRSEPKDLVRRLEIRHLIVHNKEGRRVVNDVSFDAFGGEILGIAGISGNGQKELLEAVAGLQHCKAGSNITFYSGEKADWPIQLVGKSAREIRQAGIHLAFVPEDRLGMGLVGSMDMVQNMMLKSYTKGAPVIADRKAPKALAEVVKDRLHVKTPSINTPVSQLSGGNVQKVLVGREIASSPTVLMTAYAVRGLDVNTSYTIYNLLNEQKEKGVAVIYVGEDLDTMLALCDRILVLCGGRVNGIVDARSVTKEEIGLRMTKMQDEGGNK
ncbi:MAG: ABC transporter ATP-binding protein [Eubacterium sp.]|nr:ABC transporter ATP-binding protein [Eubacterium sp.]